MVKGVNPDFSTPSIIGIILPCEDMMIKSRSFSSMIPIREKGYFLICPAEIL
jgi:hypothetical protein